MVPIRTQDSGLRIQESEFRIQNSKILGDFKLANPLWQIVTLDSLTSEF